jgi:hypothetical protein
LNCLQNSKIIPDGVHHFGAVMTLNIVRCARTVSCAGTLDEVALELQAPEKKMVIIHFADGFGSMSPMQDAGKPLYRIVVIELS